MDSRILGMLPFPSAFPHPCKKRTNLPRWAKEREVTGYPKAMLSFKISFTLVMHLRTGSGKKPEGVKCGFRSLLEFLQRPGDPLWMESSALYSQPWWRSTPRRQTAMIRECGSWRTMIACPWPPGQLQTRARFSVGHLPCSSFGF